MKLSHLGLHGIKMKLMMTLLFAYGLMVGIANADGGSNSAPINELMSSYKLGAGDQIRIIVFREPDLSFETELTDAGTIIFPFLGEINVAGLTVGGLKDKITQGLDGRYIIDPKVSISVVKYRQFYVNGEVERPGAFPYLPGLTVQKAIAMAGGFTDRAEKSRVEIIHEKDVSHKPVKETLDATVQPGDVVVVDESFF